MGIGPDPNPWIRIHFHGSESLKNGPGVSGSDPDPFKFHGSGSGFEKNTQTQTRGSGRPILFFLYINFIKYIEFSNSIFPSSHITFSHPVLPAHVQRENSSAPATCLPFLFIILSYFE